MARKQVTLKQTGYGFAGRPPPPSPPTLAERLRASLKSFAAMGAGIPQPDWFSGYGGYGGYSGYGQNWGYNWGGSFSGSNIDWVKEAGKLPQSTIVMAVVNWLATNFAEATLEVVKKGEGTTGDVDIAGHPLTALLDEPNPYYDGTVLWMSTIFSYNTDGNAYWIKWRDRGGSVVQLWYEPHFTIRPKWDRDNPETFITGYEVLRRNKWIPVDVEDVVHFRWMLDPENPRKGMNPLASAYPEVFADKKGATFSAITLRNMGAPSMVVSPASQDDELSTGDMDRIKQEVEGSTKDDNLGRVLVAPRAVNVVPWSWNPSQLNLRDLRKIPEERITALLRVPAVVAGLGAGLDRNTYNNVEEARQSGYENNLVPTWRMFGSQLTRSFRDDFKMKPGERVNFNIAKVRILQDDWNKKASTIAVLFQRNILTLDQALVSLDYDPAGGEDGKKRFHDFAASGIGGGGTPIPVEGAPANVTPIRPAPGAAPPAGNPEGAPGTPAGQQGANGTAGKSFSERVLEQLIIKVRERQDEAQEGDDDDG